MSFISSVTHLKTRSLLRAKGQVEQKKGMFLGFIKTATSRKCHTPTSTKTAQRTLQKHTALISQWFHTFSHSCKTHCRPRDAGSDFLVPPTCRPSRKGEHWNFETANKCFSLEMRLLLTTHWPKLSHNPYCRKQILFILLFAAY